MNAMLRLKKSSFRVLTSCVVPLLVIAFAAHAKALVLEPVGDTWLHESSPTTIRNNDLISVWDGTNDLRKGAILFDLTDTVGLTIDTAFLELYDRSDERSQTSPLVQVVKVLNVLPSAFDIEAYTWDEYSMFDQGGNETAFESFGAYNIAAGDTQAGYQASDFASAADITLLETTRDNNSNLVAIILEATSGERDWGDIEYQETPPRLVINEDPGVPGDFTGDNMVTTADFNVLIDPDNWLKQVPGGTAFDLNSDLQIDLRDFKLFKDIYQQHNPGKALSFGQGLAVPEPGSVVLILLATACLSMSIRRRVAGPGARLRIAMEHFTSLRFTRRLPVFAMTKKIILTTICLAVLASSPASAVVLQPVGDAWIREQAGDNTYEDDLIAVWNSFLDNGYEDPPHRRYGLLEFDLSSISGVDITTASLRLWGGAHTFFDESTAIKQSAFFLDTSSGTGLTSITWNNYQSEYASSATPLESLGSYDLEGPTDVEKYFNSMASASDLMTLESIADGSTVSNQKLSLVFIAAEDEDESPYGHSWGDGNYGGFTAELLINELPPEDVELTLEIDRASGDAWIKNPGIDERVNTTFDVDGYTIYSPAAALSPTTFTGFTGDGISDFQIVLEEVDDEVVNTSVSELSIDSSHLIEEGDSIYLGQTYTPGADEDTELIFAYTLAGGGTFLGDIVFVEVSGTPGDFNGDGTVTLADYVVWRNNLGASEGELLSGNGNGDVVDATDYALWKQHFGTEGSASLGGVGAAQVPEPSTFAIGGLALVLCACRRSKSGF